VEPAAGHTNADSGGPVGSVKTDGCRRFGAGDRPANWPKEAATEGKWKQPPLQQVT
jgi:hypothetical protein